MMSERSVEWTRERLLRRPTDTWLDSALLWF
jgi:hypothetical protein